LIKHIKSVVIDLLISKNGFVTLRTAKSDLLSLIRKLSPVVSDKELIRLGPAGDGGYLVPNDLVGIKACFSPGVDTISGFEMDCAELGMQVFLADKSVEGPAESHELINFSKKYIGSRIDCDFDTLDNWVNSSIADDKSDLILQIDVEGYEYEIFLSCSNELMNRFRIIIAEFHDLDQLWNKPFFQIASSGFEKILQTHTCVHIHPNNYYPIYKKYGLKIPPLAEFTFLRNDRVLTSLPATKFPNPLDYDNTNNAPLQLPSDWYGNKI